INANRNSQKLAAHSHNHLLSLSADGVESSVGVLRTDGYTLLINGKSDGNVTIDAANFVFSGLIGAVLHPEPQTALTIGLGTGLATGWLAEVDGITRVDVIELEKAVVQVADMARDVNFDVVRHPRVNIMIGDGREYLLTTRKRYDLIMSEPSNPYRAGVAALYTTDFYRSASSRLNPDGLFLQWLQGYEVEADTVRTVMATMASVFPYVEVWHLHYHEILLVASMKPVQHDLERVARRTAVEPFRSALAYFWGVSGPVGFYAAYLAGPQLPRTIYQRQPFALNTDDRTLIEFEFARSVGIPSTFSIRDIQRVARRWQIDRPPLQPPIDERALAEARSVRQLQLRDVVPQEFGDPAANLRHEARQAFANGHMSAGASIWRRQPRTPLMPRELAMLTVALASAGDPQTPALIERLNTVLPAEALLARAIYNFRQNDLDGATTALIGVWTSAPGRQWLFQSLSRWLFDLMMMIAERSTTHGRQLFTVLQTPLPGESMTGRRELIRYQLAKAVDFPGLCLKAIQPYEPYPYWTEVFLRDRLKCYTLHQDPRATAAAADLDTYLRHQGSDFGTGLDVAQDAMGLHASEAQ
ncbi:MAG: fused MFS/spermidine synthase, partial [Candidatus Tectomicrobia bacterium]